MADEDGGNLRDRLSRQGEEALGKLASDLLENPLINSAITRAFAAREKAVHAQEAAMGALNLPSAADIDRLTRRLRKRRPNERRAGPPRASSRPLGGKGATRSGRAWGPGRMSRSREALLREGAQAMGLNLTYDQSTQLLAYGDLILKWNKVYNLTALRDPAQVLTHHLLDSLSIIAPLEAHCPQATRLLDVGSGAGLPGAVIAIMRPALSVSCVDAVAKKAAFIRQVSAELGLPNLNDVIPKSHRSRCRLYFGDIRGCAGVRRIHEDGDMGDVRLGFSQKTQQFHAHIVDQKSQAGNLATRPRE